MHRPFWLPKVFESEVFFGGGGRYGLIWAPCSEDQNMG